MSKAVAASAVVLGGGGLAVTAAYMAGAFDGSPAKGKEGAVINASIAADLTSFKNSDGGDCVREVFSSIGGDKLGDGGEDVSASGDVSLDASGSEQKGCLVVNGDKGKASDNSGKGRGNFRFLGSFSQGNKGFIVYTSASTSVKGDKSDAEFSVDGIAYVLDKKQTGEDVWTVGKKLNVEDNKKLKKEDWNNDKLPKQNTSLPTDGSSNFESSSFWNLLRENLNKDKLCENETNCTTNKSSFSGYGSWQTISEGDKKKLGDGSSNLDKWWKEIYDSTGSKWNMKTLVDGVEGKGVVKHLSSIPTI